MMDSFSIPFKWIIPRTSKPITWSCEIEVTHMGKNSISYRQRWEIDCVEVLRPSQPNGVMSSASDYLTTHLLGRLSPLSSLPVLCTFFRQKLTTALLESAEGRE